MTDAAMFVRSSQAMSCVYEYLSTRPERRASVDDILAVLVTAHVPMGLYPRRTLTSGVKARVMAGLFALEREGDEDVVSLKRLLSPEEAPVVAPLVER